MFKPINAIENTATSIARRGWERKESRYQDRFAEVLQLAAQYGLKITPRYGYLGSDRLIPQLEAQLETHS